MERSAPELELPGFRFHPTEDELLDFYLRSAATGKKLPFDLIPTIALYRHHPWELPGLARIGEREWYFFVPRDRKPANGGRPSRTTERGFWKATGSDRAVRSAADPKRLLGLKKTLVFYEGRAPRGTKTDWVMNEYRLPDEPTAPPAPKEGIVLCKVYRKAVSLKELEMRVAMEEARSASHNSGSPAASVSSSDHENFQSSTAAAEEVGSWVLAEAKEEVVETPAADPGRLPVGLAELEVPKHSSLDWMQDPSGAQLRSPWMEQWSTYYASFAQLLS